MQCPHCGSKLTIKDAVTILNGSGYARNVRVRTPEGREHIAPAHLVNPEAVEILED